MATIPVQDEELDTLEQLDKEDEEAAVADAPIPEEEVVEDVAEEEAIVKEIDAIIAPIDPSAAVDPADDAGDVSPKDDDKDDKDDKDNAPKAKPHMISQELIDRKLTFDDLQDPGAL